MPQILATSSGMFVVCGVMVGGVARVLVVLLGVSGVAGTVSRPGGVEGAARGVSAAVRLRLVGDRCGPSETTMTSFVGRRSGLLASVELSAVDGRGRLLAVGGGTAGGPRCGAVARRGALRPLGAAVGMPAAVQAGEVSGIKRVYGGL